MRGRIVSSTATCGLLVSLWACGGYVPDVEALLRDAEAGDLTAQVNLASAYYEGLGVRRDYAEAARWLRIVAGRIGPDIRPNQRSFALSARSRLGFAYYEGLGVPQDRVLAYMWLSLAPPSLAGDRGQAIAAEMTTDEIAAARSLAGRCRESGYQDCGSPSLTLPREPGRAEELRAEAGRTRVIDVIRRLGLPPILAIVALVLVIGSLIVRRPQRRSTGARHVRPLTRRQLGLIALLFLLVVALIVYVLGVTLTALWNCLPVLGALLALQGWRRFQKPAAVAAITFASVAACLPVLVNVWWLFGADVEATSNIMIRALLFQVLPVAILCAAAIVGTIVWAIARLSAPTVSPVE